MAGLVVAVTWEPAFLADPSGAVWSPMFTADQGESLLPSTSAAQAKAVAGVSSERCPASKGLRTTPPPRRGGDRPGAGAYFVDLRQFGDLRPSPRARR